VLRRGHVSEEIGQTNASGDPEDLVLGIHAVTRFGLFLPGSLQNGNSQALQARALCADIVYGEN